MKRQPRSRNEQHLDFIRSLPCCVCLDNTSVEAAHLRMSDARIGKFNAGVGAKPDDKFTLPLCGKHHRIQHEIGEEKFWYGEDPIFLSLALYSVGGDVEMGEYIIKAYQEEKDHG